MTTAGFAWRLTALILGVGAAAMPGHADDAATYSVFLGDSPRGELVVRRTVRGGETSLSYTDRFGSNRIDSDFTLDTGGLLQELRIRGLDSYGRTIAESYRDDNGRAQWSNDTDSGSAAHALYLPSKFDPEHLAVMARALLAAPHQSLDVLPAGRARVERVADETVQGPRGAITVHLYFVHGLDVRPVPLWLDTQRELFAAGNVRTSYVAQGYELARKQLLSRQTAASLERAVQATRTVRRAPSLPIVIRGANLFDAESQGVRRDVSIVVRNDIIEAVGPRAQINVPSDAEVIEARGRTVLPGLIDMHVHLGNPEDAMLDLLAGVTTVRDMGGDMEQLRTLSTRFDSGELAGPRIIKVGMIDGGAAQTAGSQDLAGSPEQIRRTIDRFADNGYVQIKLYSSFAPELVPVAVAAAHARGLRVSGHIPAGMTMREAVEAGFDEVHHANFWFLNFLGPEINAKTNTPVRFSAVAQHGHELDLQAPATRDFIELLRRRGTIVDPTLVIYENFFTAKRGVPAPSVASFAARLPPILLRRYLNSGLADGPDAERIHAASFARMAQMLRELHAAGISIVPGTDDFFSMGLGRELELYVAAGLPAPEVLRMATLGAAKVLGRERQFGSIEPGKYADLVLIDGDPTQDITKLHSPLLVMRGGALFEPRALANATGLR